MGEIELQRRARRAGRRLPGHQRRQPPRRRPGALHLRLQRARHHPRRPHRLPHRARRLLIVCNAANRDKISRALPEGRRQPLRVRGPLRHDGAHRAAGPAGARDRWPWPAKKPRRSRSCTSFHFRDAVVANVRATVARTGYTGEDGVEIFCASNDAPQLLRTLLELGKAARARTRRARRARHAAARGAPGALRQRHRRDDQPARGRPRLGRQARTRATSSARTRSRGSSKRARRASSSASR